MKTIKLNEDQFFKLIESNGVNAFRFNDGDMDEYNGSEIKTTANIHNVNGDLEYGKQASSDEVQDMLTVQNFWNNNRRNIR
jgi:hypothetical protein